MASEHIAKVRSLILTSHSLVRAIFSGRQRGTTLAWIKVTVRPVQIKGAFHWQFSYFDEHKDITKNYTAAEAGGKVDELLNLPFKNIHVETTENSLQVTITKKGKTLIHEAKRAEIMKPVVFAHDRQKRKILSADTSAPFLHAAGIATPEGRVKASMQGKLTQINEFLRLLDETNSFADFAEQPVRVVDFGCGNAYLTFATYHYLNHILGLNAFVTGIDLKADLLEKHRQKVKALGWDRLAFEEGRIENFQPELPPDVVIALHACDTATDDAIAQGVRWGSKLIVCAPCCQHELQVQLAAHPAPSSFLAMSRDGILSERLGDLLTDAFRATILRILGYRTDVIQFVSTEHTAKNLMIRAVKISQFGSPRLLQEYQALKSYWQVTPYLERLVGSEFAQWLQSA